MNFTLKIWRQKDAKSKGAFETYKVENISADTSFLEMLDILNNDPYTRQGSLWLSTTTAARVAAACARSIIDGIRHICPSQGAMTRQIYMR